MTKYLKSSTKHDLLRTGFNIARHDCQHHHKSTNLNSILSKSLVLNFFIVDPAYDFLNNNWVCFFNYI